MGSFPIFVDLDRTPPLVVGATDLAVAKARLLLKRAKRLSIAAPAGLGNVARALPAEALELLDRWPTLDDIRGRPLMIVATGYVAFDARISATARWRPSSIPTITCPAGCWSGRSRSARPRRSSSSAPER